MKVLLITAALPPMRCGGADYAMRLASELSARGMQVSVLGPQTARDLAPSDFRILPEIDRWNWSAMNKILEQIRALKPDVVDIIFTGWIYEHHPMVTFLPTFIHRVDPSIKVITHLESLGGVKRSQSKFLTAACRAICSFVVGRNGLGYEYGSLLRDSDGVIFLGDRDRDDLIAAELAVPEKSVVIPPPPIMPLAPPFTFEQRQRRRDIFAIGPEQFLLSFFGYVYPGKGIEFIFGAMKHLISSGRKVKLMIVGDAPEQAVLKGSGRPDYMDEMKAMCQGLGLSDHVVWIGYAPYGSTSHSEHLHLADCCVLPFKDGVNQHNSSFWFTAAHKLPIVTTYGATTEAIFQDERNVMFCQAADALSTAACITKLIDNVELRTALGREIGKVAEEQISWSRCIDDTIAMYNGKLVSSVPTSSSARS